MKLLFSVICAVTSLSAFAAPIPGGTAVKPQLGVYKSPVGYEIAAATSTWKMAPTPKSNSFIVSMYTPVKKSEASLTLRIDKLNQEMSLQAYVERWKKEYPKYGFDVLGSKSFEQNSMMGYAIDLIQKDTRKEMRQVVFMKNKKAMVMTCKDREENFRSTLIACNQIMRTFKWTE